MQGDVWRHQGILLHACLSLAKDLIRCALILILTSFKNQLIILLEVVLKTTFNKLVAGRPELDISGDVCFESSPVSNHALQFALACTAARLIAY